MIKGLERKIIMISGSESALFESAYFVLRKSAESGGASHEDMVREANRIIELCLPAGMSRAKRRKKLRSLFTRCAFFLFGALIGAVGFWLILALFGFMT